MIDQTLARSIRLVGLDVDGVMTDGGVYIGVAGLMEQTVEFKRFHILDGLGVKLLRAAGIPVVLVSGRESGATVERARELDVDELVQNADAQKLPAFERILECRGLRLADCAFVGDDLADLPLLKRVGLPIAVANAVPEVKQAARLVTQAAGGDGAVREVAEVLLRARGEWQEVLSHYLRERGDVAKPSAGSR